MRVVHGGGRAGGASVEVAPARRAARFLEVAPHNSRLAPPVGGDDSDERRRAMKKTAAAGGAGRGDARGGLGLGTALASIRARRRRLSSRRC